MPAELKIILDDVDNQLFAFIAVNVVSLVAVYFVIHAEHKVNGDDGDNDDEHDVEKIDDVIPKTEKAVVVNLRRDVDDAIVCIADMVLFFLLTLLRLLSLSVLGIDTLRRRDVMVVKIEDR
jgi:hypothetical protein